MGKETLLYIKDAASRASHDLTELSYRSLDLANEFESTHPELNNHPEVLAKAVENDYQRAFAENNVLFGFLVKKCDAQVATLNG